MSTVATRPVFEKVTDYRDALDARADRVRFVDLPECRDFAVDGAGAPGGDAFQAAFRILYPVAYTLHFALKRRGIAASVGVLEGIFWSDDAETLKPAVFLDHDRATLAWRWSLRLPVPPEATEAEIAAAIADVGRKPSAPPLDALSVVTWAEGRAAQVLHIGPYEAEPPTIERLHETITASGLTARGRHHEIYISDPNRTAPEHLKTVIRQPVEDAP